MSDLEHISTILPRTLAAGKLKTWVKENMVIVCDTREKENRHITGSIEQLGVKCSIETLKTGDYAYRLCGELRTDLIIERKNSLDELAANITKHRDRFERELERAKESGSKLLLLIEKGDYDSICDNSYRANVAGNVFRGALFTFEERYGIDIKFVYPQNMGNYIMNKYFYHVLEMAKSGTVKCI